MATSVEFDVAARSEFDEAFDWYAQRSLGAAIGFASEVDAAVEKIAGDPERLAEPMLVANTALFTVIRTVSSTTELNTTSLWWRLRTPNDALGIVRFSTFATVSLVFALASR